jgi:hypothetical protein
MHSLFRFSWIPAVLFVGAGVQAQVLFVTTPADVVDFGGAELVGDLPGPDGLISLREATLAASHTAGAQTIGFQIPVSLWGTSTTGPVIENLGLPFRLEDDETTVDGLSQTAFTGDTNPLGAEVAFHSTLVDVDLIQTGTFQVISDRNVLLGLGDMTGRNYGIDLLPQAEKNRIEGCVIRAVFAAVRVQGDRNRIGGTTAAEQNRLDSLADGLRIQGLGADPAEGNLVFGNELTGDFNGVQITGNATKNRIGGLGPGEGNWIAGAGYFQEDGTPDGAMVRIESDGNFVLGNRIGTDASGTAVADNPGDVGVEIYGDGNLVQGNVIGGITGPTGAFGVQAGIHLREGAQGNVIQGNWIGVGASGTSALQNHVAIQISAFDEGLPAPEGNRIGGLTPGEANTLAFYEENAVRILTTSVENTLSGNSIRDGLSGAPAIDLGGDGPTPNDAGDLDLGPNALMNFPVLDSAVAGAAGTFVIGRLDTQSPAAARVELFASPIFAPGAPAEAHAFLGAATPGADGAFAVLLTADASGLALSASATDAQGNTSELSDPRRAQPTPFSSVGSGVAGAHGVPALAGGGTLVPGTQVALLVSGAAAQAPGFFALGTSASFQPLFAGTLVPAPQVLAPFATDASGFAQALFTWPSVPSGTPLYAQAGLLDPQAALGVAMTAAITASTP